MTREQTVFIAAFLKLYFGLKVKHFTTSAIPIWRMMTLKN